MFPGRLQGEADLAPVSPRHRAGEAGRGQPGGQAGHGGGAEDGPGEGALHHLQQDPGGQSCSASVEGLIFLIWRHLEHYLLYSGAALAAGQHTPIQEAYSKHASFA